MSSKATTISPKKDGKPALVPKLRFPGFREATAWAPKLLGSLFSQREEAGHANLPLLSLMDKEGIIPQEDSNRKSNASGSLSKYLRVAPGDIAYNTMRMWEGRSALSKLEGVVSPAYTICCPAPEANSVFFSYYFKTPQLIAQFARYSQGLVKDTLNLKFEAFARIPVATPCDPAEQQRVAECLSSVDEAIAAQARKVDALKTHKKGLMQQLFPREGETQPRLRFPEFEDTGKWVKEPLGKLLLASPDYGVNAPAVPFSEDLPRYLRITDISEDGRYLPAKQVSVDLDAEDGNYLREGDIVFARTGASVGKSYQYRQEDGQLVFAGFLIRIKPDPKKLVSSYLANFLTSDQFWNWVAVTSARSGQPGINSTEYSSLAIPLPPRIEEQQRIAACLSILDDLIAAAVQKREVFNSHKRGLMQQLFPSPMEAEA